MCWKGEFIKKFISQILVICKKRSCSSVFLIELITKKKSSVNKLKENPINSITFYLKEQTVKFQQVRVSSEFAEQRSSWHVFGISTLSDPPRWTPGADHLKAL